VNVAKTIEMVFGKSLTARDLVPEGGEIEIVESFCYLGSVLTRDGEVMKDIKCRITKASRALGCLNKSVFDIKALSIRTKRKVYNGVVLAVLLKLEY